METNKKKLTTASGIPYAENENSMTVGPRGPILLQDFILHEKMAHFNRERIPERVVHARGTGAHGVFEGRAKAGDGVQRRGHPAGYQDSGS